MATEPRNEFTLQYCLALLYILRWILDSEAEKMPSPNLARINKHRNRCCRSHIRGLLIVMQFRL